jgi:hypothetical protein
MFPGKKEASTILEMAQIKGMPTEDEFARLDKLCPIRATQLLQKNDYCVEVDLAKVIMSNPKNSYIEREIS